MNKPKPKEYKDEYVMVISGAVKCKGARDIYLNNGAFNSFEDFCHFYSLPMLRQYFALEDSGFGYSHLTYRNNHHPEVVYMFKLKLIITTEGIFKDKYLTTEEISHLLDIKIEGD